MFGPSVNTWFVCASNFIHFFKNTAVAATVSLS